MILYIGKHDFIYSVDYHSHEYTEFVYCTSGSGVFENEGGDRITYEKGDLVIVPTGMVHANISNHGFSNYYLALDRFDDTDQMLKVKDNERGELLSVIEQAYFHFNDSSALQSSILTSLSELLISYVREISGNLGVGKYSNMIIEDIVLNFSDPSYTPDEIYSRIPYSREYMIKKFQKELGCTPKEYLIEHRLELCRRMLEKQDTYNLSIKDIAGACGFSDPLYMSRLFRKRMGISPKAFAEKKA